MLFDTAVISSLHANLFRVALSQQNVFQVTSEGATLILKKFSTKIRFDKKMANNSGKGFLLNISFYKSANDIDFFSPRKGSRKGRQAYIRRGKTSRNKRIL